jgi:hypothetical protein
LEDFDVSDVSSVSSSELSDEQTDNSDEELVDKDVRRQQKRSIFGFQVKENRKGKRDSSRVDDDGEIVLPKLDGAESDDESPDSAKAKFTKIQEDN